MANSIHNHGINTNSPQGEGAISVSNKLFDYFQPHCGDELPKNILGSEIVNIGVVTEGDFKDDFVIEYIPKNEICVNRIILSYNDRTMWISYLSPASNGHSG